VPASSALLCGQIELCSLAREKEDDVTNTRVYDLAAKPSAGGGYALDNDKTTAPPILGLLSTMLDDFTASRLIGAGIEAAHHCLELGAGNGSVASWMAGRVGPSGRVVAVDIKPQHVKVPPAVHVVQRDVSVDELPEGLFHIGHARLLLAHLPSRWAVLDRLVARMAPHGAVVIEEWGETGPAMVLDADDPQLPALYAAYQAALLDVFRRQGNDTTWSVGVAAAMRGAGLVNIDVEARAQAWQGGSPGCRLPVVVSTELHLQLVATGLVDDVGLEQMRRGLLDRRTVLLGNALVSTVGYVPA
jgi:hypothetical protein